MFDLFAQFSARQGRNCLSLTTFLVHGRSSENDFRVNEWMPITTIKSADCICLPNYSIMNKPCSQDRKVLISSSGTPWSPMIKSLHYSSFEETSCQGLFIMALGTQDYSALLPVFCPRTAAILCCIPSLFSLPPSSPFFLPLSLFSFFLSPCSLSSI